MVKRCTAILQEEFNSMHNCTLVYCYFVIDVCVQPRLAQEILELTDITSSTRTQKQQPLFILSLWMKNHIRRQLVLSQR